jgi:hypothetical protein
MVPILAKNAVKIKCNFKKAVMTGNYECAYALGILTASAGIQQVKTYENLIALKEKVMVQIQDFKTEDLELIRLQQLVEAYEPSDVIDGQMKDLYSIGIADKRL